MDPDQTWTAAQGLVAQLVSYGVEHVFCVPGESYLAVLDALIDSGVTVTVCRHEGGAAMMADALARRTGKPAVAFVTRAPGAANALVAVHIAHQDQIPLILFAGQVSRPYKTREAWQETDFQALFGGVTKWTGEPFEAARLGEYVSRAFHAAMAGRPGPVVVALPRDLLAEKIARRAPAPLRPAVQTPSFEDVEAIGRRLAEAKSPIMILGGSVWTEEEARAAADFATAFQLPVATSYRRLALFDADHPHYVGDVGLGANPALIARVRESDCVLLLGGRMGEVASQGFTLFEPGAEAPQLIHVFPDPEELGRLYTAGLPVCAAPGPTARALSALSAPAPSPDRQARLTKARAAYLSWSEGPVPQSGPVNLSEIMLFLRRHLPPETILCNGAGGYASWIHRFYRFRRFATHMAPTSATMGYGVPAAVAMKRHDPAARVVALAGDGDFLMNGQEFATAVQYDLPFVTIILDNGSYGSIRMSQEQVYPGRVSATDLKNPDFAAYARAFGGFGVRVERTEDFPAAFIAAEESGLPAIVHVLYDVDGLTPSVSVTSLRNMKRGPN